MLYICDKKGGLFGVKDTDDNVVEYVNRRQLFKAVNDLHIKINGVNNDGTVSIYTPKVSSFNDIIDDFIRLMKRSDSVSRIDKNVEEGWCAVRHWGDWEVPSDVDEDELEDYDWEELSSSSRTKLNEIISKLRAKYTDVIISVSTNEKNWIDMQIQRK